MKTPGSSGRWKHVLLGAVWLGFFAGHPSSQAAAPRESQPGELEVWHPQGWQQGTLTTIVQSRDGLLWLGTYHGLVRYDGVEFTVFDSSNAPHLQNGLITSLYETPDGVLWIGHETGHLTRLARGVFEPVNLGPNWPGGSVEAITSDESGELWLLNDGGVLFRLRDGLAVEAPGGATPSRKVALAREPGGHLWLCANGKAVRLEKGRRVPCDFGGDTGGQYIDRVLPARDGGLWVLSTQGLRKWREGAWGPLLGTLPPEAGAASTMLETRSGAVLVGTVPEGVYRFAFGAEPLHFSRANGLSHDWVRALCEDHEGGVWIGTGSGLDGLRPRDVSMLNPPDQWRGCIVHSFTVLPDGSAWVGTEGAGLYHFAEGRWSNFTEAAGVSNLFVWSVLVTRDGDLLAGTWGGGVLARTGERFAIPDYLKSVTSPAPALYEDKDGDLWIGTTTGLQRYHHRQLVWSAGKEQLAFPDVRAITETPDGTLWFGMSGGGLGRLQAGQLRQYRKTDGLGSDQVVCLYTDPDGTLWVGTSDNGLTRLKNGKFSVISTANGLPTRIISSIVDDRAGNLWLGSHLGILRAGKAELNLCAEQQSGRVRFLGYGLAEGLESEICSGGFQPGACLAPGGRLWFPTAKGLALLDPARARINLTPPPVTIQRMLVDTQPVDGAVLARSVQASGILPAGAPIPAPADSAPGPGSVPGSKQLRIAPGRHRVEFQYSGLSYIDPGKVAFKYRLEGLEREWQDVGNRRVAPYSYLPPGHYRFRVIACNNDDVWNETGASLAFTVLPYVWQTWWFELGALAAGAGLIGSGVLGVTRRRVRGKMEQLERQRALERERARIARDIHDDLGASLTRISMLSQSVRGEVEGKTQAASDADQIYSTARELTRAMDEIVWAVNPKHDTLDSLVTYLGRFAQNFLSTAGIRCRLDVPLSVPSLALTSEVRHNVFLALKEALNNTVKHAGATEVRVALELEPRGFVLMIIDNGRGFDWNARLPYNGEGARASTGNGLANMQKRLEEIGGQCEWQTAPGEGTRVKLTVTKNT